MIEDHFTQLDKERADNQHDRTILKDELGSILYALTAKDEPLTLLEKESTVNKQEQAEVKGMLDSMLTAACRMQKPAAMASRSKANNNDVRAPGSYVFGFSSGSSSLRAMMLTFSLVITMKMHLRQKKLVFFTVGALFTRQRRPRSSPGFSEYNSQYHIHVEFVVCLQCPPVAVSVVLGSESILPGCTRFLHYMDAIGLRCSSAEWSNIPRDKCSHW